jgi:hypothetical protein
MQQITSQKGFKVNTNAPSINNASIPGPTPLPPAGAPAGVPSDRQPSASASPPSPAATAPSTGGSEVTRRASVSFCQDPT